MVFEEKEFKDSFSSIVQYRRYLQLLKDHNIKKVKACDDFREAILQSL